MRVEALGAAAPRLGKLSQTLFEFLVKCLNAEKPPLLRLSAAKALGDSTLHPNQLLLLANEVESLGPLEVPKLLPVA